MVMNRQVPHGSGTLIEKVWLFGRDRLGRITRDAAEPVKSDHQGMKICR
jgi:hypothetical protein